jgi:hypothetical protein
MFDEAFSTEQGTNGGRLKAYSLTTRQIPQSVIFRDRPVLDQLVEELTDTLSVRYEKRPAAESFEALVIARNHPAIPESVISEMVAFKYEVRTNRLASSTWLVNTVRRYLAHREIWPLADKAVPQAVEGEYVSGRKRTSDKAGIESNVPSLGKFLKRDDGSTSKRSSSSLGN